MVFEQGEHSVQPGTQVAVDSDVIFSSHRLATESVEGTSFLHGADAHVARQTSCVPRIYGTGLDEVLMSLRLASAKALPI